MVWPSCPDRVHPRQACDREMMCEADVAETVWFLLTTSANPPQATGLSAPQPSRVPICKWNAEHYKLFRDWSCVSACNRPRECSKEYNPMTKKKKKLNWFLYYVRRFILVPYMHYHQIWLNVSFVKKKTSPFKVFRQPWSMAELPTVSPQKWTQPKHLPNTWYVESMGMFPPDTRC